MTYRKSGRSTETLSSRDANRHSYSSSDIHRASFPAFSPKKSVRRFFFKALLNARARRLTRHVIDSTGNCSSLLDLGCGDMILTEFLHHHSDLRVTAMDTVDSNLSHLPVILYDGNLIPFADAAFEATMVAYVLHHCHDISAVLEEMKRVTSKKLIVFEEVYECSFSRKILHLHDFGNRFLSTRMNIPRNFMKIEQWYATFAALDLKVERCTRIYQYPLLNLTHQVLFELTV